MSVLSLFAAVSAILTVLRSIYRFSVAKETRRLPVEEQDRNSKMKLDVRDQEMRCAALQVSAN